MVARRASGLKSWVYPKGSGIRIREVLNRTEGAVFGGSFLVTVPSKLTGKLRERQQFKSKKEAEEWADQKFTGYRKQGQGYFELTDEERREVAAHVPTLRKHGLRLGEVVRFAIKRMRPEGRDRLLKDVIAELVLSKEQRFTRGDLREASYRDFKNRGQKIADAFAGRIAAEVTGAEIKKWLTDEKLGTRSNKNYLSIVGEIFKYAGQKRYVAFSPLDDLTDVDRKELCGGDGDGSEPSILSPDQAEKLLNAALAQPKLGMLGAVTLGLFCGLRTEELKRLDWSHVRTNDTHPIVTVGASIAKKRRIRNVDIPANALLWLSLCPSTDGMREGPVAGNRHANDYQKRFRKLQGFAGFERKNDAGELESTWESNAMRHSFGSYHYALHGNPLETARQMGHRSNDQVLFDHYRALATKTQAQAYFAITPPADAGKIVKFA